MKKSEIFSILLFFPLCVAVASCSTTTTSNTAPTPNSSPSIDSITGLENYILSEDEILKLTDSALAGNVDDSRKLVDFYSKINLNFNKADFWKRIAAENGAPIPYGDWLVYGRARSARFPVNSHLADRARGIYWICQGSPNAASVEQELKEVEEENYIHSDEFCKLPAPLLLTDGSKDQSTSSSEISRLEILSLAGSIPATNTLLVIYSEKKEVDRFNYWLMIQAENGAPSGQIAYARLLAASSSPLDKKRAAFWLERYIEKKSTE